MFFVLYFLYWLNSLICYLYIQRRLYYRALVKTWDQISKGHISVSPSEVYLGNRTPLPEWDPSLDGMLHSFQRVAQGLVEIYTININGKLLYCVSKLSCQR